MQKIIFSALLMLLEISARSQYTPSPVSDTLKMLYEENAIHLSNWGMYQKDGSYYNNGFWMSNLKKELEGSTDAIELFSKGRNMQFAGVGATLAGSLLIIAGPILAFSLSGNNNGLLPLGVGLSGVVVMVGGSIVISIGDFKIRKAVDYYNRDILLKAISKT